MKIQTHLEIRDSVRVTKPDGRAPFFNYRLFIICGTYQEHFGWTSGAILEPTKIKMLVETGLNEL